MRKLRNLSLTLIGSMLLSACWLSSTSLITKANAEMPDVEGLWASSAGTHYDLTADEATRSFSARTWTRINPTAKQETLSFDAMGKGWYILQSVSATNAVRRYELVRVGSGEIAIFLPECNSSIAAKSSVRIDEDGNCFFSDLKDLRVGARTEIARVESSNIAAHANFYRQ